MEDCKNRLFESLSKVGLACTLTDHEIECHRILVRFSQSESGFEASVIPSDIVRCDFRYSDGDDLDNFVMRVANEVVRRKMWYDEERAEHGTVPKEGRAS